MKFGRLFQLIALAVLTACGGESSSEQRLQIAVIPKGTTHAFWKSIHAGAAKAADEFDVDIIWLGPEREDDRKMQIEVVQNFISRGVDAIVLAPLDNVALVPPVEVAVARGITTVIIDSGIESDVQASFIATDNREGGRMGARSLGELMGGAGRALMLRYQEGSASTMNREEGFLEVMASDFPGIELVSTNQYGGATKDSAVRAAQNILNRFADVDGIFCPNESVTFGMLRALQTSGRVGTVKFVGFDASEELLRGLRAGEIDSLVVQDPFNMGYLGVKTAVAALNGEPVEKRIPTRLSLVTIRNIDEPEIKEVIEPDLDTWLK